MSVLLIICICIISLIIGFGLGYKRCYRYTKRRIDALEKSASSAQIRAKYWQMFFKLQKRAGSIRLFLDMNDMQKVAIYGYGVIGKYLEEELMQEGIKVVFVVDQSVKKNVSIPIYTPTAELPEYDVMLVTTGNADEVRQIVAGTADSVIELEDILKVV